MDHTLALALGRGLRGAQGVARNPAIGKGLRLSPPPRPQMCCTACTSSNLDATREALVSIRRRG